MVLKIVLLLYGYIVNQQYNIKQYNLVKRVPD